MAARERKSAVNKQLNKDVQADGEKTPETPKIRRSRKSASSLANDIKTNSEQKSPSLPRKRKKAGENATDGRSTPNAGRGRRLPIEATEEELIEIAKTPPPSGQKARKAFLEKELEDILENATGRNTPSMSRRKINEKEEENIEGEKSARTRKAVSDILEGLEEKGGFFLPKPRKGNEKDVDDDNLSVRSFPTFLRARKNFDKEIDDDNLSVRSMTVRSKKGDPNEDDTMSVRSLPRPKKVKRVERKKKTAVSPTGKKKVLLKKARASPKKGSDIKGKKLQNRKPRVKAISKDSAKEKKRVIKKPLNIQTKKKAQKRLQNALLIKKQRLKKPKNPNEKKPRSRRNPKAAVPPKEESTGEEKTDVIVEHVKTETERLKIDNAAVSSEVAEPGKEVPNEEIKKGGKAVSDAVAGAKAKPRSRQIKSRAKPVGMVAGEKRRRESNIHFEMTPCPDDSEVIIVQPRLGPRKKTNRRKKDASETAKPSPKKVKTKDVTTSMIPIGNNVLPTTVTNYSTIGTPYILPNYNLLGNNQSIVRNFNSNAPVNPNFDSTKPVGQSNLPYSDESNAYGPKVTSNEILITQTGIMLSGGRIVPSVNQHPGNTNVRFPNSSPGFVPDNGVMYPSPKPLENPSLIYQNSTNVLQSQSCPTTNTAMLIKKPELMSTSLISTSAGTLVISPNGNGNNLSDISLLKPQTGFTASTQTDTIMSEKALEGDTQTAENISILNRYRNVPRIENLPTIPVAKSVNDLLLLKSKSEMQMANEARMKINQNKSCEDVSKDPIKQEAETPKTETAKEKKKPTERRKRRVLRNVRINQGSGSELTFSEPESCPSEAPVETERLFKTVSCERLLNPHKPSGVYKLDPHMIYEFGSEPVTVSDAITPFETASSFSLPKTEIMENKIDIDKINGMDAIMTSPKAKEAAEVCNFSKENEEALKELGLDSDMDQTKSEGDADSPPKLGNAANKANDEVDPKKAKMKEEVDHVLREMPIRRIPNLYRRTDLNRSPQNRLEMKNPLVVKNNDYLSKSPVKAPTVIDKLLEKNKSLKKAEQEGKFQNSVRNLSENFEKYEEKPIKRNSREMRSRKFTKDTESRRVANKKFANDSSSVKIFERRGSNPEIYSNNYQIANENLPLRRVTDPGDKFQRRGSVDYDSIQKVIDRRCSLPEDSVKVKIPKNAENVNKVKTENIKTIVVGSSSNLASKNRGADGKPRIINIVTSDDGTKKGQNLMDEIGMDALENCYVNGDKTGRRTSVESCNSETENIKKLMDGLPDVNSDGKLSKEVPYCEGKSSRKLKGSDRRKDEQKSAIADESPEDLATKETILSALGLQSLKAAAQNAQKKKDNPFVCQPDSAGYTGTLKTVIKIQRQEKKGGSKAPLKMIYKASSSSNSTATAVIEETNSLEPEIEITTKEDADESPSEDNKNGNGKAKSLVIPEKASSFSIHPGRMCSDVCTYCFGKFGLLDTPCHIAQLKDADKRRNILAAEVHLTADSCLCDACFRHVDKKSNCPTFTDKKTVKRKYPTRKQICCVQNCNVDSQHSVRRKSFLKLKKSIGRKIMLDPSKLEKLQPAHLITLCHRHIYWIDYFMSCGICKKRLTSVNMYRVGPDVNELNSALSADGIPTILTEKRFLCKVCHCYASIRIKCKEPSEMSTNQCQFYENYRKRILQCHGIDVPDSEGEENDNTHETKSTKTKTKKASKPTATITNDISKFERSDNEAEGSAEESSIKTSDKGKDSEVKEVTHMNIPPKTNGNLDFGGVSIAPTTTEVNPTQIHVKLGNLNIGALGNLNIGQDVRHGTRPGDIQCFPTETELALRAHFDLNPSAEDQSAKAPRKGFEKCTTTIQFNEETKNLFYNLQMPYGNHSSFFRHLILLEKYFRSGDLVIGRNADPKAVNYISSVQNRIRSYEGIHNPQPQPQPQPLPPPPTLVKKPVEIPPSLSIVAQPAKTETRGHETKSSVIPSRPFTLTPMPSTASLSASFSKTSPLSQIQATVQNIPTPTNPNLNQGIMGSFLKSVSQHSPKATTSHPKPEISITSVPNDSPLSRNANKSTASAPNPPYLTSKLQENLKKLATKMQNSKPSNQARAVILNRTIGGQKQSLVQVTTGGKTIHLTLTQFRRIQQMQIRKKQYLEHQAKLQRQKEEPKTSTKSTDDDDDDDIDIKHLSPELEIQEVKQKANGNEVFPIISDVRTLSGEDSSWDRKSDSNDGQPSESFPKIPKTLSVSVTKIPPPDYSLKEQSVDPVE